MDKYCSLVMDLLPLYHDGVCSEDTEAAITEHLKTCEECKKVYESLKDDKFEVGEEDIHGRQLMENLSKDLKKRKRKSFFDGVMVLSLLTSIIMFFSYFRADVQVLEDGTLVEPFALIPLGYLFGFVFLILFVIRLVAKRRKNK